jgi:hypothetical protein
MSNIKEVVIEGYVPFNTYDHPRLNTLLGQVNSPVFGIRVEYQWSGMPGEVQKQNKHGGTTSYMPFQLVGREAVPVEWLELAVSVVALATGWVTYGVAYDVDDGGRKVWQVDHTDTPQPDGPPQPTVAELIGRMLRNAGKLDRDEEGFKEAIGKLSNIKRELAYNYVRTLREHISLLQQLRDLGA